MDHILATSVSSVSEFKKNPNDTLAQSGSGVMAILTNNKPSFYVLTPEVYELVAEQLWEFTVAPTVRKRLAQKGNTVKVSIEDL
jgi:antitoxin StbD